MIELSKSLTLESQRELNKGKKNQQLTNHYFLPIEQVKNH